MNERKISSFYRTLSPIGPAALPPPMKSKEKVEQGKGTADHLMPLGYLLPCVDVEVGSALTSLCRRSLLATYKMFIRSLFDYGAPLVFPNYSKTSITWLQRIQNRGLRPVLGCRTTSSVDHLHDESKELPVEEHLCLLSASSSS